MRCSIALIACAFLSLGAGTTDRYARLLPAIEHVESSGRADAVGDGLDRLRTYAQNCRMSRP